MSNKRPTSFSLPHQPFRRLFPIMAILTLLVTFLFSLLISSSIFFSAARPSTLADQENSSSLRDSHRDNIVRLSPQTKSFIMELSFESSRPPLSRVEYVEVPSGREDAKRYIAIQNNSLSKTPISIQEWMTLVSSHTPNGNLAASDLSNVIASSPYASILFETPGTSLKDSAVTPFEFVIVNRPALKLFAEGSPDREAFEEHFDGCLKKYYSNRHESKESGVPTCCFFANLGGDARLVSPLPQNEIDDIYFSHLAAFVRHASKDQISEFWRLGATQYLASLKEKRERGSTGKTWFSTNGMGVAWLHLRLDSRPKYYSYDPFKQ